MRFDSKPLLAERAAYNGINLSEYFKYPTPIVREILYAFESGCTKAQVNGALEGGIQNAGERLRKISGTPDIQTFLERLIEGLSDKPLPDYQDRARAMSGLIPAGHGPHTWSASNRGFTRDALVKRYREKETGDPNNDILLQAFDQYLDSCHGQSFTERTDGLATAAGAPLPNISYRDLETLASYAVITGRTPQPVLVKVGGMAMEFGLDPWDAYALMLDTAVLIKAYQDGVAEAERYLNKARPPVRYGITETGILRKRIDAAPIERTPPICQKALENCRNRERIADRLFKGKPDRNAILTQFIYAMVIWGENDPYRFLGTRENNAEFLA